MSTSRLLLLIFSALALLCVVAMIWRPGDQAKGRIPLVWVSGTNPARQEQIATFNREEPGYFLSLDLGDSKTQKVILQCSSGIGPDIFDVYDGDQLQTYVEAGVVWDITSPAGKMGFSADGDAWPTARDEITYQGKQYSYPCNVAVNILIYNKNVFDFFNIPYPEGLMTWEDFLALSAKVSTVRPGAPIPSHPVFAVTGLYWNIFFESLHGQFFTEDGLPVLAASPELRQALEMHRDFIFKYRVMPTTLELKSMSGQGGFGSGSLNQFASGRFAMIATGEWALIGFSRTYYQQVRQLKEQGIDPDTITDPLQRPLRLGCVLLPRFPDLPPSYRVKSRSAAINSRSPRREQALTFLKYLAGPVYSRLINEYSDSLPGNPKYSEIGIADTIPSLSRLQMHETSKTAMSYGYSPRRSPFITTNDITEVLRIQVGRMESDPSLSIDDILQTAQHEVDKLLQRNLSRNPELRKEFEKRFGKDASLFPKK